MYLVILLRFFSWDNIKEIFIKRLNKLDLDKIYYWDDRDNLIDILNYLAENNLTHYLPSIEKMILTLSKNMIHYYQIESFSGLIAKHLVYKEVIENAKEIDTEYYNDLQKNINKSWEISIEHYIKQTYNLNLITTREELVDIVRKRKEEAKNINYLISIDNSSVLDDYEFDYDSQLNFNNEINNMEGLEIKDFEEEKDIPNEVTQINKLFNSNDTEEWDDLPF